MEAFFPDLLQEFPGGDFLAEVCGKFHYEEEQLPQLGRVAAEMLPHMRREAFWDRKEFRLQSGLKIKEMDMALRYETVVMSLGGGVDTLQEKYHEKGLLSESYMLEALAGELLRKGYEAYSRYMEENGGWHVAGYHFPGSGQSFPLEMLPKLLKAFEHIRHRLACNEALCMSPQKSVVFIAGLSQDKRVRCEGICAGCANRGCPYQC